ncbi:hypothetical protein CB7_194 [Pectobacterium phage vB_PatM_CB7]|nr:hypothetical protein CB7_194 [Pectobacterium phage vB_PatM_CB7]
MEKLECKTVGNGYEKFFTVGKVYGAYLGYGVADNDSIDETDHHWELEPEGVTVRAAYCDEDSAIVATFEIVEE